MNKKFPKNTGGSGGSSGPGGRRCRSGVLTEMNMHVFQINEHLVGLCDGQPGHKPAPFFGGILPQR